MKNKVKEKIKKWIYNTNMPYIAKSNIILLESVPTMADNTLYVYKELIRRKINEKYKLVWVTTEDEKNKKNINEKNVYFLNRNKEQLRYKLTKLKAKYIIDCNNYICKYNKNQIRIYLGHGMPIKIASVYGRNAKQMNATIVTSNYFSDCIKKIYGVENVIVTGHPRNDALENHNNILFKEIERKKTIVWMPTYRNHKGSNDEKKDDNEKEFVTGIHYPFGVPCIKDEKELHNLNNMLKENKILLILKLHPAENLTNIKEENFSNIKILKNEMIPFGKTIYDYLGNVDALITDYSSIYYDFLLTKKPIGLTIPDLKEYSKHLELISNNYKDVIKGEYIYTYNDLIQFFENVKNGVDPMYDERMKALDMFHKYKDFNSSVRVVDYIFNKKK